MAAVHHLPVQEWSLGWAVEQFFAEGFRDGDVVSRDWLKWALDITDQALRENEFLLLERMEAFKSALLLDHKIALQNVKGRGYRVVPPAEQARFAAEEASRHFDKGLRKAERLLSNTRRGALSTDEARRHTDTEVRMAGLRGMINKGNRDVFALFSPGE